jgi:predicted lysophospholipase L1 biosynthesis ABC-type transport system permease subunit
VNKLNYKQILSFNELGIDKKDKKIKPEYVRVRAAKSSDKPPLIVSIPRTIANELKIEVGDTFAMMIEGNNKIVMIKATI